MNKLIYINGEIINYELILKRRKTIAITIDKNCNLCVKAPISTSISDIDSILIKNQKWIQKKLFEIKERKDSLNDSLMFMGETIKVNINIINNNIPTIELNKDVLTIKAINSDKIYINDLIRKWYKERALEVIGSKTVVNASKFKLSPSKIIIKEQKSRWGSCNSKREIRLNWRLIMMPESVMDYVIIHELCHLKFMNHSKEYWNFVESIYPKYKENSQWLKVNGNNIMNSLK